MIKHFFLTFSTTRESTDSTNRSLMRFHYLMVRHTCIWSNGIHKERDETIKVKQTSTDEIYQEHSSEQNWRSKFLICLACIIDNALPLFPVPYLSRRLHNVRRSYILFCAVSERNNFQNIIQFQSAVFTSMNAKGTLTFRTRSSNSSVTLVCTSKARAVYNSIKAEMPF